ncbi:MULTISPECIES: bifunctional 2-polyprenyl-6-hydroxyphenol methylase/3-demethylubiquinol 3-O-methyltransferase UbiG [unclassified Mesorhizobium]|uniref:class I SAM-dependent methyltransferase n=1 Tax=unclassified Mesorhizobium TaxID=325217 RepID=UPI0006F3B8CA|nr:MULTISPECIES: class I SAM-dependent methyltransferase [unclassified Mesorhizobium]KQZ13403.1 SAM-dependent methyltransferase [Mesorhizobium sp. Root1471]KQZ38313.1 SAM-dependent methyltransferase [Mesorhizobium sp. Root554]MDR7032244.1 SAM-dependent methyltransferase [Mesorhizobium sp. BE184]
MTQNIYDDPRFFKGYSGLPRSVHGLAGAPEWPSLRALLPPLSGASVIDLGCGFGWFCRWAREQGAFDVLGLDVSRNMLERARNETQDPNIRYEIADLEQLMLPAASFDLVYSSLAFHYIVDLDTMLNTVHRALKPGGRLVFSAEHPLLTAPSRPGWTVDGDGRKVWPVDDYLVEGPRTTDWLASGVVKQHRTIATYFRLLREAGFTPAHIEEWGPTDSQIAADPALAEERQRPTFMLFSAFR